MIGIGIDTDILLRLWLDDDPAQNKRIDSLLAAHGGRPGSSLVTDFVLVEAVWTLKSAFEQDKRAQSLAVRSLLDETAFAFEGREAVSAALSLLESGSCGFADCRVVANSLARLDEGGFGSPQAAGAILWGAEGMSTIGSMWTSSMIPGAARILIMSTAPVAARRRIQGWIARPCSDLCCAPRSQPSPLRVDGKCPRWKPPAISIAWPRPAAPASPAWSRRCWNSTRGWWCRCRTPHGRRAGRSSMAANTGSSTQTPSAP